MKINALLTIFAIATLYCVSTERVPAQNPSLTPLNTIRIGHCSDSTTILNWIKTEQKRGLIIDARPFAINQSAGKLNFSGDTGRVSVVNMNPFVYEYKISVTQEELVSTAVTDFVKLLLPQGLRTGLGLQSGKTAREALIHFKADKLAPIESRLLTLPPECPKGNNNPSCLALAAMYADFEQIRTRLNNSALLTIKSPDGSVFAQQFELTFSDYKQDLVSLRDEQADAPTVCLATQTTNNHLNAFDFDGYFKELNKASDVIRQIIDLANDLQNLTTTYEADTELKKLIPRCSGFSCVGQFKSYAEAVLELAGVNGYEGKLNSLRANAQEMNDLLNVTEKMKNTEGVFARTFDVIKKFETTDATVTVARTKLPEKSDDLQSSGGQTGKQSGTTGKNPKPAVQGGASSSGSAPNENGNEESDDSDNNADMQEAKQKPTGEEKPAEQGNGNNVAAGQINESIQIGRPRFLLSGGLVFSPLRRRTFETVKGFTLDGDGNPTGDGNKDVVGFGENSPRRLMPMAILNSRLFSLNPTSVFFSLGVTAKHDDNVDVEYLLGPSLSLLNDRALFTFGAYVGKVQNLVPDVKIGDEIPDSVGDAKLFTKRNSWKPGFSFSYVFSETEKRGEAGSGGGGGSTANDLKNEIRIGGIPFNLALGLAYTSLEERNFDEVVGFARDRQGNLTNGKTLTRIVGLTSSSNYRLVPLALLHSRLLNFGNHSFYFSTGLTGQKTDNDVDIEYLLGGSVNLYRRKVFFTVGAFAGKQQLLGGDFFTGAKLDTTQNVTTQKRYVWKPAFAISYDISKIIPKGSN